MTEETKQKLSKAHKGYKWSPEAIAKREETKRIKRIKKKLEQEVSVAPE